MTERIFSQDRGIGLDDRRNATWASAADLATLAERGESAFVVEGFDFAEADVDGTNGTVTVPAGQAILHETGLDDGRTSMEWLRGAFPVRHPGATLDLATSGDTDVWLDATIKGTTTPNDVSLVTGSTPSEPRLQLGTVFEDGTVELTNQNQSQTFDAVNASEVSSDSVSTGDLQNESGDPWASHETAGYASEDANWMFGSSTTDTHSTTNTDWSYWARPTFDFHIPFGEVFPSDTSPVFMVALFGTGDGQLDVRLLDSHTDETVVIASDVSGSTVIVSDVYDAPSVSAEYNRVAPQFRSSDGSEVGIARGSYYVGYQL